jgi:hypothetical protein
MACPLRGMAARPRYPPAMAISWDRSFSCRSSVTVLGDHQEHRIAWAWYQWSGPLLLLADAVLVPE